MRRATWRQMGWMAGLVLAVAGCESDQSVSTPFPAVVADASIATPMATVRGEVFEPDGRPSVGCEVMIFHRGPSDQPRLSTTVTDAVGAFDTSVPVRDPLEPIHVLAWRAGFALDAQGVVGDSPALLQLGADPKSIAGTVIGADGQPVSGARVSFSRLPRAIGGGGDLYRHPENPFIAVTDTVGHFDFSGLRHVVFQRLRVIADGHARHTFGVGKDADPSSLEVVLRPESVITGRVVYDGAPVAGAVVRSFIEYGTKGGGEDRTITDADGTFTLRHLWYGTFNVFAEPPDGLAGAATVAADVAEGERREVGDLVLTRGAVVSGRVTDVETGDPIPGACLIASGPARPRCTGPRPRLYADADGRYECRLAAGENRIRLMSARRWRSPYRPIRDSDVRTVTVAEGESLTDIDFQARSSPPSPALPPLERVVTLFPENGEISAYEPLVVRQTFTNPYDEPRSLPWASHLTHRIQVRDANGHLAAITPRQTLPGDLLTGTIKIQPGEIKHIDFVVSALYTFAKPGQYEIRIQQLEVATYFPRVDEFSAQLTVLPLDEERLALRCKELFDIQKPTDEIPWFQALCSVRHDAAVPYLYDMARRDWNSIACRGLFEIDSPAAREAIAKLVARDDRAGEVARSIRDEPPRADYRWPMGIL